MFFAAHNPLLGLINIVPQILVIIATIVAFYRIDRIAGWCLIPLAAWVCFATVLNFAILEAELVKRAESKRSAPERGKTCDRE